MNPSHCSPEPSPAMAVHGTCRWEIYRRLQELEIPCQCSTGSPLCASVLTPTAAVQVWSVVRQVTASRRELTHWLQHCWQLQEKAEG